MTFKLNISEKGKTHKLESESSVFLGKKIGESVLGKEIDSKLEGFELKITGASSKEGFPLVEGVEGVGLKRVLLKKGKGMRNKKPKGLRLRKTVHAHLIDKNTVQINLSVSKTGAKPLDEVFGTKESKETEKSEDKKMEEEQKQEEQKEEEKTEEKAEEQPAEAEAPAEENTEEAPAEEKKEETAEEKVEEKKEE